MKSFIIISLLFSLLFGAVSCEGLFKSNLYREIDKEEYSDFEDMSLDELQRNLDDEDFLTQLGEQEDSVIINIITDLNAIVAEGGTTGMEAAVVKTEIALELSGASDSLNNVNDLLTETLSGETPDSSEPADLLAQLMNTDDQEALEEQIGGLLFAAVSLDEYGTILGEGEVPDSIDSEEMATLALFTGMVLMISDPDHDGIMDNDATAIADYIQDPIANPLTSAPSLDELFDDGGDGTLTAEELEDNFADLMGAGISNAIMESSIGDAIIDLTVGSGS